MAKQTFQVQLFEPWREALWQELCGTEARPTAHQDETTLRAHLITTEEHNQHMVRQTYLALLGREPESARFEDYTKVRADLRRTYEYRIKAETNHVRRHLLAVGKWPVRTVKVCRGGDVPRVSHEMGANIPRVAHLTGDGVLAQSWRDAGFTVRLHTVYEQQAFMRKHGVRNFAVAIVYFEGGWFVDDHFCATPPDASLEFVNAGVVAGAAYNPRVGALLDHPDDVTELPDGVFRRPTW